MRRTAALAALVLAGVLFMSAGPGQAAPASASARSVSYSALNWAEGKAGCWYSYGGTSCAQGYDCSGLVMSALNHAGYGMPRTTGQMLSSGRIYRIPASQRRRGDLVFWGNYHVEFVTMHGSFGAQQPGTRVGWHRLWGSPTYWRIR